MGCACSLPAPPNKKRGYRQELQGAQGSLSGGGGPSAPRGQIEAHSHVASPSRSPCNPDKPSPLGTTSPPRPVTSDDGSESLLSNLAEAGGSRVVESGETTGGEAGAHAWPRGLKRPSSFPRGSSSLYLSSIRFPPWETDSGADAPGVRLRTLLQAGASGGSARGWGWEDGRPTQLAA